MSAGSVIGCKQFSCSGDVVWRLIMGCRRMLGVEDRAAIMAGVDVGLRVKMCVWLGVSRGLDLAFLNAD